MGWILKYILDHYHMTFHTKKSERLSNKFEHVTVTVTEHPVTFGCEGNRSLHFLVCFFFFIFTTHGLESDAPNDLHVHVNVLNN